MKTMTVEDERKQWFETARKHGEEIARLEKVVGQLNNEVKRLKEVEEDYQTINNHRLKLIGENIKFLEALKKVELEHDEAVEERYQFLEDCRHEAEKWKKEGDMYGYNFHQGMAGGANQADLYYARVGRILKKFLKENS